VSTIQRISNKNGVSYRVFVRIKGLRTISKTFPNNVLVDGVSLEKELLDNELAYSYDGGKKLSWCK